MVSNPNHGLRLRRGRVLSKGVLAVPEVAHQDTSSDTDDEQSTHQFHPHESAGPGHYGVDRKGGVKRHQRYQSYDVEGEYDATSEQQNPIAQSSQCKAELDPTPQPEYQIEDGSDDAEGHDKRISVRPCVPAVLQLAFSLRA